jgi:hypothetical protein
MKEIDGKKRLEIVIHTSTVAKIALAVQDLSYVDLLKASFPELIKAIKALDDCIKGIEG